MSDDIKHECGIAFIRLLKPLEFYIEKYRTVSYGLNKLYLLMEKQHNRGQDGAGVAVIKLNPQPGTPFINRHRSIARQAIPDLFEHIFRSFPKERKAGQQPEAEAQWYKQHVPFVGELLMGHLRYGTHGKQSIENVHPFIRENNWMTRNLVLAGNFNMTNSDELFMKLIELGQHPRDKGDTVTVMEKFGHFLDDEIQQIFDRYKDQGYTNRDITEFISRDLKVKRILTRAAKDLDGGYALEGMIGHGDAFVLRDPNGIRPAYFYQDEEVVVVASERPAIQTTFHVPAQQIHEISPGHALIIKKDGRVKQESILPAGERKSCSFERIYFSRGTDSAIYEERKALGYHLTKRVLEEVEYDFDHTVFSFIPNTAEVAFYGLLKGLEDELNRHKQREIEEAKSAVDLQTILHRRVRMEKIAVKDVKMRTFITDDAARDDMVSHVYDITYGSVRAETDTLVVIDDSIVRGTTLEKSILSILDRLSPKKIVVVSSCPQIRYPDCYGIDMSRMNDFIAFRALIQLIDEHQLRHKLEEVYELCRTSEAQGGKDKENHVKKLYALFSEEQVSRKIAEIVRPKHIFAEVSVLFQRIEDLHRSCPQHTGDWYFTGDYPTAGGNRVANRAFINYMEGKTGRAY